MLKLNLGCGHSNFGDSWEHIDSIEGPHIKSHDITKLPYEDNSADIIYSSHTLEYFDREEVLDVLKEWNRVLKVGGNIYLSVPDFRAMANLYVEDNEPLHKFLGPLYGKMDSNGNTIYHKTVWDYQSLGDYLRIAGFRRIDLWTPSKIEKLLGKEYDDCSKASIDSTLISLNIEATKNEYEGKK